MKVAIFGDIGYLGHDLLTTCQSYQPPLVVIDNNKQEKQKDMMFPEFLDYSPYEYNNRIPSKGIPVTYNQKRRGKLNKSAISHAKK